jgi:energy-coupling factor transporter ATP-binding protein EcfA2
VDLVILDDVVMSIDAGHRKNVCKLLKKYFGDIQFIITTHNRTWARQMRTDGLVIGKNMFEFMGWSVDTGPKYQDNISVWDDIKKHTADNQIATAAHLLREHLEFFFEGICDSLRALVPYRTDSRYELGFFMNGAKGSFGRLLKQAKASANSWGNQDVMDGLSEIETQFKEDVVRTQIDQWIINENVHFDKLSDSSKEDFLPIVEAFNDFEKHYICSNCGSMVMIQMRDTTETSVKCQCSKINWNLELKN